MSTQPDNNVPRQVLAWLWGGLLIVGGLVFLAMNMGWLTFRGPTLPYVGGGVALLSLPFVGIWLFNRRQWWWLIPAWVFIAIALLLFVIWLEPPGQIIAMTALWEIALPFLVIFLLDRSHWWALIPAYTMVAISGLLALTMPIFSASGAAIVAFVMLAVALPFWLVYLLDRTRWWALIPAGVTSALAAAFLIFSTILGPGGQLFIVVLNAALGLVLLALWITNRRFDWALWIAVAFLGTAVLSIWFPLQSNWPLIALAVGGYIIFRQLRKPGRAAPQTPAVPRVTVSREAPAPTTGPEADKTPEEEKAPEAEKPTKTATEFRPIEVPSGEKAESDKDK